MNLQHIVQEQIPTNTTLQVFHRQLAIPKDEYIQVVKDFSDPWDERAYQYFIIQYLQELSDPGMVGMVRQQQDDEFIYLDAAIRYVVK